MAVVSKGTSHEDIGKQNVGSLKISLCIYLLIIEGK